MSPFGIGIDQSIDRLGQTFRQLKSLPQRVDTGNKVNHSKEDPSTGATVRNGRSAFQRLQAINARSIWAATNVRAADQIMDTIGKYLEEMKAQLTRIIKNYPPFPPGSEDRVRILRSYNALRKQIDQMTFEPKNRQAIKTLDGPAGIFEGNSMGLNLPKLSDTASDKEIAAVLEYLDSSQKTIQGSQAKLAREALETLPSEVVGRKWAELGKDGEKVEPDLSEKAAESKSQELGHTLRAETISLIDVETSFINLILESD
jgi:hypothetical protein